MIDVCLVAMPYAAVEHPSISLGLLKASLLNHEISAKVHYANIFFAEQIGIKNYFFFSNSYPLFLMGEWTFSGVAFPDFRPDHAKYLDACRKLLVSERFLWNIRSQALPFIDETARKIIEERPRIVGCSSMFQQHCASLALLRRIKALRPEVVTLLGGANCEGSMGYVIHQHCQWVDYVVSGESELLLPGLCKNILEHDRDIPLEELPEGVYGPLLRNMGLGGRTSRRAIVDDMNASPTPVYDDYFDTLEASPISKHIKPGLVFETSRGCWWGQKKQCVFCGLNGGGISHRKKSPDRVLSEMTQLSRTYGNKKLMATDSMLDMSYFATVLPKLEKAKNKYTILFETPANLTKKQVEQLSKAGILWINPGIESLHDNILGLLKKGTCAWKNVQLLKWCLQYGIFVSWSFLVNVPGESEKWYQNMMDWLPLIYHLQPPIKQVFLHYDRFSPFHSNQDHYNLELKPLWVYSHIYPLPYSQLNDFAYYFEDVSRTNKETLQTKLSMFSKSHALIDRWQECFYVSREDIVRKEVSETRPMLTMEETTGRLIIKDTRPCAVESEIVLEGLAREIYEICDSAKTSDMIEGSLHKQNGIKASPSDISAVVERLVGQKILLRLDGMFLSLAIKVPYAKQMLTHDDYPGGLVMIPRAPKTHCGCVKETRTISRQKNRRDP